MTTISVFIKAKFEKFGVNISDSEIEFAGLNFGFDPTEELTVSNTTSAKLAIVSMIPEMLLIPNKSEGGYSISMNNPGMKDYYSFLCDELGIENKLIPKVRNRSNHW